jgi:uncharacterized protein (TIGR02246 family)
VLTADVVLVNAVVRRVFGRDSVPAAMAEALRTPLANVLTRHEVVDIRFLRQDVAVASGVKHVSAEGDGAAAPGSRVSLSLVLVREGTWRIAVTGNALGSRAVSGPER